MADHLEIVIYLTDGSFQRYKQNDPQAIARVFNSLQPPRVFSQKQIIVAGSFFMAGYPTEHITQMDMIGGDMPHMRHAGGIVHIAEISEKELDLYARPRFSDTRRSELVVHVGEPDETVAEINLSDTQRIGLKIRYNAEAAMDRRQLMQVLTGGLPIFAERVGGGTMFINPNNVIRWAFYPGIPDTPQSVLPLHRSEIFGEGAPSMMIKKLDSGDTNLG